MEIPAAGARQLNCESLSKGVAKDQPLTIDHMDSPYARIETLRQTIMQRGL